ncbi:hypothetical protein QYB59_000025 [Clostridium perfringens]|nr:hypothetical protein [Clostridium perfringens]
MKIDISKIYGLYEIPEYGTVCKRGKTIKDLEKKILDKNEEIKYLNEVIDALEEEKEELDDECYELEEENTKLMEEIKEKENIIKLLIKPTVLKVAEHLEKDGTWDKFKTWWSEWDINKGEN